MQRQTRLRMANDTESHSIRSTHTHYVRTNQVDHGNFDDQFNSCFQYSTRHPNPRPPITHTGHMHPIPFVMKRAKLRRRSVASYIYSIPIGLGPPI